ncbi:hypothetical protein TUM4433_29920 [Shewanella schlegeliana]|nr:hypothetical protein TUM4433_29920 [Shewanella schlegeliana]
MLELSLTLFRLEAVIHNLGCEYPKFFNVQTATEGTASRVFKARTHAKPFHFLNIGTELNAV